jgi:hypothetical protein
MINLLFIRPEGLKVACVYLIEVESGVCPAHISGKDGLQDMHGRYTFKNRKSDPVDYV